MSQIIVKNLGKSFIIPHERRNTLKESLLSAFKKNDYEHYQLFENLNFEIKKGEFFGIIGSNGSGKSTLLKIIAGILKPNTGEIVINGKVAPFLELGIGFQQELTARENIYINGALLGLSQKQIHQKMPAILEFAEIGHFLDLKIKNFSSGMRSRLAFAIATQAEADIYLCDEVLAVGDEKFQKKCLEVFKKWKSEGKTIILVSHALDLIQQFCSRSLLIEKNSYLVGESAIVINRYLNPSQLVGNKNLIQDYQNATVKITSALTLNRDFEPQSVFETGEDIIFSIKYNSSQLINNPVFGLAIYHEDGTHITGPNTKTSNFPIESIHGNGRIDCRLPANILLAGRYLLTVSCFDYSCAYPFDYLDKCFSFTIIPNRVNQYGLVEFNLSWEINGYD